MLVFGIIYYFRKLDKLDSSDISAPTIVQNIIFGAVGVHIAAAYLTKFISQIAVRTKVQSIGFSASLIMAPILTFVVFLFGVGNEYESTVVSVLIFLKFLSNLYRRLRST